MILNKKHLVKVHPKLALFTIYANTVVDYDLELTSGFRTLDEQAALDKNATNALPGQSPHNYGLAVDIHPVGRKLAQYQQIGELAERWGLEWGGRFLVNGQPDYAHVQVADWRKNKEWMRGVSQAVAVISVFAVVAIVL